MRDCGGSQDDGDNELPLVLQINAEKMLKGHSDYTRA
jgi:hypothetical protein